MKSDKKNKHMTLDDRVEIQECLCKRMTFKAIAMRIGKDPTTISKEVKLHAKDYNSAFTKTTATCPKLLKAPFVCNGCEKQNHANCVYPRRKYAAKNAQKEYETVLVESREGIPRTKQEFYDNEEIISDAVKRGQHIYHIIQSNNLPISTATVYRHIQKRYYSNLPRAVKFKQRNSKGCNYVLKWAREDRTFDDFLTFVEDNSDIPLVQLDTVIGRIGDKVIMTVHFVNSDFMFGLLLDNKNSSRNSE